MIFLLISLKLFRIKLKKLKVWVFAVTITLKPYCDRRIEFYMVIELRDILTKIPTLHYPSKNVGQRGASAI